MLPPERVVALIGIIRMAAAPVFTKIHGPVIISDPPAIPQGNVNIMPLAAGVSLAGTGQADGVGIFILHLIPMVGMLGIIDHRTLLGSLGIK